MTIFATLLFFLNLAIGAVLVGFAVSFLWNKFVVPHVAQAPTLTIIDGALAYVILGMLAGSQHLLG